MDSFGSAGTPVSRTIRSMLTELLAGCISKRTPFILSSSSSAVPEGVATLTCFHADCISWPVGQICPAVVMACLM